MITFAQATKPWLIAILFVAFSLLLATGANANSPDFAIAGGWFFTQGGGDTARSDDGFAVIDDEDAKFWSAFQASGGVAAFGYPISDRFQWDGFVTQVMQKAVFQWRPETDSVAFVNVFDDLSRHGFDDQLATLLVPEPEAFNDETGLSFGQIIAKRTALLEAEPALLAVYRSVADPLRNYGLPQSSVRQYDGLRAIRLQRVVLQIWTSDFPWATAGTVTIANGGDLAKQLGLFRQAESAFVPISPPGSELGLLEPSVPTTAWDLLAEIAVEAERTGGYSRADWRHWSDFDGDGCDTRCEVLADEQRPGGDWHSVFDGQVTDNPSTFDIDHLVPLAEAHESGGWAWDEETRELYANDQEYAHSLIAVSASSNRSKGKRDPAEWLPPAEGAHCFYAEAWVVIKWRWQLSIDQTEQDALTGVMDGCPATSLSEIAPPQASPTTSTSTMDPATSTGTMNPGTTSAQVQIDYCDASAELVEISGPAGFDLGGWQISDQGPLFSHTFSPGTNLRDDGKLLIASGRATGDLKPWGGRFVWNNDGDVATLTDPTGQVVATRDCS